jgi:hypothetical protein
LDLILIYPTLPDFIKNYCILRKIIPNEETYIKDKVNMLISISTKHDHFINLLDLEQRNGIGWISVGNIKKEIKQKNKHELSQHYQQWSEII